MKKRICNVIPIIATVVFLILVLWASKAMFEAVYYSDMPDWLKYVLLH